jgi:hypothetical protein
MSGLVDFNISTPRNRTQSSNECGVVINNHVSNCLPRKDPITYGKRPKSTKLEYPPIEEFPTREVEFRSASCAPSVVPQDSEAEREVKYEVSCLSCEMLRKELELYKEIALTFSRILKNNNKKLLANIIDQSNKIIVDNVSLCRIISIILDIPLDFVHLQYSVHTEGCLSKLVKIADIQDIKINHIDFRLGYNEKYNILLQDFNISLTKVMI